MTFEKGSLILVDYTARVKDTDEIFDTTSEEEAKKHSIHDPLVSYAPKLVSIGDMTYPVLAGFGEALAGASAGEKLAIEVTPDKGFGERDPKKVRMIPTRKLGDDAEKVSVGDMVEIDDKKGIIRFIGSGRVQIDYNHRYAGKTIVYDASVTKLLETPEDKVGGILGERLPGSAAAEFKLEGGEARITIPTEIMRAEGIQITKHFVQADIFRFIPSLERVVFVETHVNAAKKQEAAPEQKAP